MPCESRPHPLPHDGSSQPSRRLPATAAGYVRADERDTADWIVAAARLARHIAFVDEGNIADPTKPKGDWQPFFAHGETSLLALLAVQNATVYHRAIADWLGVLRLGDESETALRTALGAIFSGALSLAKAIDNYAARLPQSASFSAQLGPILASTLRPALKALLRYYKGALDTGLITEGAPEGWRVFEEPVSPASAIVAAGLSTRWTDGDMPWTAWFAGLPEDKSVFGEPAWDDRRRLSYAASYNLFTGAFDRFAAGYARLVQAGGAALQKALEGDGTHPPHTALFLAFLKLYGHVQEDFNTFGQRHLDFYYKEVLRLRPRTALPPSAHLLIELAKGVPEVQLPKGTRFATGKDRAGVPVVFTLDRDTVVNTARVAQISSLYRGTTQDGAGAEGRLFYSPVAASADGLGEPLKTASKDWHPFAPRDTRGALAMPEGSVGFAVSSQYLLLGEGYRVITLKLPIATGSAVLRPGTIIDCFLTAAKGWHYVANAQMVESRTSEPSGAACTAVRIILPGDAPGVVGWDAKLHGGAFELGVPVLKVVLRHTDAAYAYAALQDVTLRAVELDVRVGIEADSDTVREGGLKALLVSGDAGPLDPSKPFMPFGLEPKAGATLTVGSDEAFRKAGARIRLRAAWLDKSMSAAELTYNGDLAVDKVRNTPWAKMDVLRGGSWTASSPDTLDIIGDLAAQTDFPAPGVQLPADGALTSTEPLQPYGSASRAGFIRATLQSSSGHAGHRGAMVDYQIAKAKATTAEPSTVSWPGSVPYTPKLASLTMHYTADTRLSLQGINTAAFDNRALRFYHVHPGGEAEQHPVLTGSPVSLLPQAAHGSGSGRMRHAGELYIGVEAIIGGQGVSLLVQASEGTTDPLVAKPADHVTWSYLSGNVWKDFPQGSVTDATDGLIRSGIVEIVFPEDARADNTILAPGMLWLRAAIGSDAGAVARLLSIASGAARVTFQDSGNAADFVATPQPAGSITKLAIPMAAVKKVMQPYAEFGGRAEERMEAFYPRAAERLRHRGRAVTLWDYEHLVLEAFPALHRVKCLPHTSLADGVYRENAPGAVTLVTIPNLSGRTDTASLRPFTHEDVLQDVRDFLRERVSGHTTLYVGHPQFEEVEIHCKLQLAAGLEFNFWSGKLREELTAFLSPWAAGDGRAEVEFGSRLSKSALIDFIEERPYVDFITDVRLYHIVGNSTSADLDDVTASTARSVLVSAPAGRHRIEKAPITASEPLAVVCRDTYDPPQLG